MILLMKLYLFSAHKFFLKTSKLKVLQIKLWSFWQCLFRNVLRLLQKSKYIKFSNFCKLKVLNKLKLKKQCQNYQWIKFNQLEQATSLWNNYVNTMPKKTILSKSIYYKPSKNVLNVYLKFYIIQSGENLIWSSGLVSPKKSSWN